MRHSKSSMEASAASAAASCRLNREFTSFIGQMNEKYNFVGVVRGLSKSMNGSGMVRALVDDMHTSCSRKSETNLREAMLKSAAYLVLLETSESGETWTRELVHELSVACCHLFTRQIVSTAVECWSWVISSRGRDLEPLVCEEMLNAWQMSVDLRLGMFSRPIREPNPLAKEEQDVLKPQPPPDIDAHRCWIKYLQERLDIAKYKSELELELFYTLLHKTLSFSVDLHDSTFNRHVSCVGLRFRFLVMALSLVQQQAGFSAGSSSPHSSIAISKWIIRERIYYTALDYFTVSARSPTQSSAELREDIQFVLEFWNKMVAEKKYLREDYSLLSTAAAATPPVISQSDSASLTGI